MAQNKKSASRSEVFKVVSKEGRVSIELKGKSTRLRWTVAGRTYCLTVGIGREAFKVATARAREVDSDILMGRFDDTLVKYSPEKARQLAITEASKNNLMTHWENYKTYKSRAVQKTTQKHNWTLTDNCLAKVKDPNLLKLENADKFLTFLLTCYSPGTLKRVFDDIVACVHLAIKQDKLIKNPYSNCKATLVDICKVEKTREGEFKRTKESFSHTEIQAIFNAFEFNEYCSKYSPTKHSFYLPYVKFLAFSGCRPEEAIALTSSDLTVQGEQTFLAIDKAYSKGVLKGTKTNESRIIPVNDELMDVLNNAPLEKETGLFFPSIRGGYLDQSKFQARHFRKVISGLYSDGKVSQILPTYNLRHSRITSLLKDGINPSVVAQLMGTSTEMINKHYCGNLTQGLVLPPMMKPL